jgi:hypothetical protein
MLKEREGLAENKGLSGRLGHGNLLIARVKITFY